MKALLTIKLVPRGFGKSYSSLVARVTKPTAFESRMGYIPNASLHYLVLVYSGTKVVGKLGAVRGAIGTKIVKISFSRLRMWLQQGALLDSSVWEVLTQWGNGKKP